MLATAAPPLAPVRPARPRPAARAVASPAGTSPSDASPALPCERPLGWGAPRGPRRATRRLVVRAPALLDLDRVWVRAPAGAASDRATDAPMDATADVATDAAVGPGVDRGAAGVCAVGGGRWALRGASVAVWGGELVCVVGRSQRGLAALAACAVGDAEPFAGWRRRRGMVLGWAPTADGGGAHGLAGTPRGVHRDRGDRSALAASERAGAVCVASACVASASHAWRARPGAGRARACLVVRASRPGEVAPGDLAGRVLAGDGVLLCVRVARPRASRRLACALAACARLAPVRLLWLRGGRVVPSPGPGDSVDPL